MKRIYLDNAATTPLDKRVSKLMRDFELKYYGNPNSTHREGQSARALIDTARAEIARFIAAKPQEITFTSGATEANNHAIRGVISHAIGELKIKPHVITTQIEHQSIYHTVKMMQGRGVIDATFIKPSKDGLIDADEIIKSITDNTVIISIIFVSNEIGSILPIREIAKKLAEVNKRQKHRIYFHTDAVQAIKYFNCNVDKLGVDLMTMSAHKINGPKGIGALYIRTGTKIDNLMTGGSQEYDKRPGTQNSPGIIGFASAVKHLGSLEDRQNQAEKVKILRDKLISELGTSDSLDLNGPTGDLRAPDNVNFNVYGVDQELLMTSLDLAGISASTGSACVSGSSEPSHVIRALGKINDLPAATFRLTLGHQNTLPEIKETIMRINQIVSRLKR